MRLIDNLARSYLKRRGYGITRRPGNIDVSDFVLMKYEDENGAFDYDRYVAIQTAGNKRKIANVFADEATIDFIADYLRSTGAPLSRGLCHGSRNGSEVRWFRDALGIEIVGTDISDTASEHGLVQWDFHEANPEWLGSFDFVYTNSHDHAYDPGKAFRTWADQLAPTGRLVIEHTKTHTASDVNELDPFGVDPVAFPYVVLSFAQGRFGVTRVLRPPHGKTLHNMTEAMPIWIFIIERLTSRGA